MTTEKKLIEATSKYIRISPSKIDRIISKIRGKTYKEALKILKYLPQKSAVMTWQTLYSAVSNASNNFGFDKNNLIISQAFVNQGAILKRVQPRSKGKAFRIEKKFSHITIKVSEHIKK
jgi:large subunit ribosomal protein L22